MPDRFEHIIEDIYTLEPALRDNDTEVRTLVMSLVSAKPVLAVDEAFVLSLRNELLSKVVPVPKAVPSPWMMYLAPIGAMAVLILMLVPGYLSHTTPTALPQPQSDMMNTERQMDAAEPAAMKRSADTAPAEASMMMMAPSEESGDMMSGDMLTVFDQTPGRVVTIESITLTAPGFVVIQTDVAGTPGAVLGVSPILFAETSNLVDVPLTNELVLGAMYFATVYHDDGDGVFSLETDLPAVDAYSALPIMYMFGIYDTLPQ